MKKVSVLIPSFTVTSYSAISGKAWCCTLKSSLPLNDLPLSNVPAVVAWTIYWYEGKLVRFRPVTV